MKPHFALQVIVLLFLTILLLTGCKNPAAQSEVVSEEAAQPRNVWSEEQSHDWYQQWGWLRGANFLPRTAINQLEMWQAESFDARVIVCSLRSCLC